jgi:hypothetical protein
VYPSLPQINAGRIGDCPTSIASLCEVKPSATSNHSTLTYCQLTGHIIVKAEVQCRLTCAGEGVVTASPAEVVAVGEELVEEVLTDEVGWLVVSSPATQI